MSSGLFADPLDLRFTPKLMRDRTATCPILVERSMHTDANGVTWAAGTNAMGTRLP